jgi:hypothetical protein
VTTAAAPAPRRSTRPIILIGLPAAVAIWVGWVGLGRLTGFGVVQPFPGIPKLEDISLDSSITLAIGMEAYAAYALRVWLGGNVPARAARFAGWSALGALMVGGSGQVAYHVMVAAGITSAPWWITTLVACVPVGVVGMAATLHHLLHTAPDAALGAGEAPLVYGPQTPPLTSPEATSPATGEAPTPVPGAGGTPPAVPPRGRAISTRPTPQRGTAAPAGRRPAARSIDQLLDDVKSAIGAGDLPAEPSANAIRMHLRIAPKTASTLRDRVATEARAVQEVIA